MTAGHASTTSSDRGLAAAAAEPNCAWGSARAVILPLALVGVCLYPLARAGYVLQVDAVFGPRVPLALNGVGAPLDLISHLVGGAVAGRLFLGGALFLCAFGPMFLLRRQSWLVQIPAGCLGALNPWVYDRLVEGQWGVAAGVGVLFLWVAAWEALQRKPGPLPALLAALAGWGAVVFDPPVLGMILLLSAASLVWHRAWRRREWLAWGLGSLLTLGAMLAYALPPFLLSHQNGTYYAVRHFGRPDLVEFRSTSGSYGLWPNLIGLYGFWPERLHRIPLLYVGLPWWPLAAAVLVVLAAVGAAVRRARAWLLVTGVLGLGIAGSTATGSGREVFLWLIARVPLLGVYREPQKWSELWLVALVVLSAEAVTWMLERRRLPWSLDAGGAAVILLVAATMLPAGARALRELPATIVPARYPSGWLATASYMSTHVPGRTPVVVLPWSLYETLPFTGHLLTANPAATVFPGNLISPNDLEIPGVSSEASSPGDLSRVAANPKPGSCALARSLVRLRVSWAIVEPAPGGAAAAASLLGCGFRARHGSLPALVLLHR